jgi:hypothetical protein
MDIPLVAIGLGKYYPNGKVPSQINRGSFWWRGILKLLDLFKGVATVSLQNGRTCQIWHDLWEGSVPAQEFPEFSPLTKTGSFAYVL